jgi:hypothetical protein
MTSKTGVTRKFLLVNGLLLFASLALFAVGCHQGAEGDRCNPSLIPSSDECNSGLTCQVPSPCVEAFCCPMDLSSSSNSYCNGTATACSTPDAGTPTPTPDAGTD